MIKYALEKKIGIPVLVKLKAGHHQVGNPSSSYIYGKQAKKAVELAREQVAQLVGCKAEEIIFTSGGSEANNQAIVGAALANAHKAVLGPCHY